MEKKTIKINSSTHKRLEQYGKFGDTFDSIINRLLDEKEEN